MAYHYIFISSITNRTHFFITKLNCSSPNSIHFHQIMYYYNHQIYWPVTKKYYIRQSKGKGKSKQYLLFMAIMWPKQRICFKFHLFSETYFSKLNLNTTSPRTWWCSELFWWLKIELILVILYRILAKSHWIWWY
jgi:hypothetical protein